MKRYPWLIVDGAKRHPVWRFYCYAYVCRGSEVVHISGGLFKVTAESRAWRWAARRAERVTFVPAATP